MVGAAFGFAGASSAQCACVQLKGRARLTTCAAR